jgi:pimeloyl-ACP methyl ester carboxylesterase
MAALLNTPASGTANRRLLVMLPGATHHASDLIEQGIVDAVRLRDLAVDCVAMDTASERYLETDFARLLHAAVIVPALGQGYRRFWLLGISLGASGAFQYFRERQAPVDGVVLIAPFLALRGTIAEIVRAGGLEQWQTPVAAPQDEERLLLSWIKNAPFSAPSFPRVYLGYGRQDRYAPSSAVLAQRLPSDRVYAIEGGHDWPTWRALWSLLLDRGVMSDVAISRGSA